MNVGLYQSASSLSALEKWQDAVSQNITSAQVMGYRKRVVNFSTQMAGELQYGAKTASGKGDSIAMVFPAATGSINYNHAEAHPTRREFDVALMGEGYFELRQPDGSMAYTRAGEFRMRSDRTLVSSHGFEVMTADGNPITLLQGGGPLVITENGLMTQGGTQLGRLSVKEFADEAQLYPLDGSLFAARPGVEAEQVEAPTVQQGYLEGSNVASLREMVDLVLISRAYEANQRIISSLDQQMQKTLDALG